MGNCYAKEDHQSKGVGLSQRSQSVLNFESESGGGGGAFSVSSYDIAEIRRLEYELKEKPHMFILNNLLMGFMFFEDFEKEIHQKPASRPHKDTNSTPTLLRDEQIECITPDILFETVNKHVHFRSTHGNNKDKLQPLVPKRLFVVSDTIEVLEKNDTPQYSAIDKPNYQVHVKDSEHSGFVKLECVELQGRKIEKNYEHLVPDAAEGPSSHSDDQSDIYAYSTITEVNTPKRLKIIKCERRDTLPKTCFTTRRVKKYEQISDSNSEAEYDDPRVLQEKKINLYETISYISSAGFMNYFKNGVFPNSLGKSLGFEMTSINIAKAVPGKIFCNLEDADEDFRSLPCEIIPCVFHLWSASLIYDFNKRDERPTMWDKSRNIYKWPNDNMIKDISALNCVLIPRGFIKKKGENSDSDIEWEVAFPQAERYLDTHMNHTQIRAFMFLLTLFKSYIQPKTKLHGLLIDHIRTHLYWECESNPRDWPEHRLGTRLLIIIKNFETKLAVSCLPDYFIKKKNVFENIPNKFLRHAQKIFHQVLGSPVIYFIAALRNLEYNNSKFYPKCDLKKLYNIITVTNDEALKLIHSKMPEMLPPNLLPRRKTVQGDANYKKDVKWRHQHEMENRALYVKKKEQEEKKQMENLKKLERKNSADSLDLEFQLENVFETIKNREVLIFFIKHFVEMAKRGRHLNAYKISLFYLKQAFYLAKVLDNMNIKMDSEPLLALILKEEEQTKKVIANQSTEEPPTTPIRNSVQFNWDISQQVKGNIINLNNLTQSFNNSSVPQTTAAIRTKKQPSNLKVSLSSIRTANGDNKDVSARKSVGFVDFVKRGS